MIESKISVLGLYYWDNTLFDGLQLPEQVDKETLVDLLLTTLGGFECLYPDADFMKKSVKIWSGSRLDSWKRSAAALLADYNPLHNFDRLEDYTTEDEATGNGSNYTAAWNAGELQESGKGVSSNKGKSKHTGHLRGNIGTTKTQEMIWDELELRKTDLYRIIIDDFKCEYCILIY